MSEWPFAKRYGFAFVVSLFVLLNWPFPIDVIPGTDRIVEWLTKPWDALVPLAATRVFHVAADVKPNGSGDTTYNYVQVALFATIALLAGLLWAALDRKSARYERVRDLFRVYIRFALGLAMISYGALKLIQSHSPRFASILLMSDTRLRYTVKLDERARTLDLTDRDDPKSMLKLKYARLDPGTLVLDGVVEGHALHAVCHLSEMTAKPLLTTRGFHWINEYPFNR